MRQLKVGDTVLVKHSMTLFQEAPAIVTRVWNENVINCTAFPDMMSPKILSSLMPVQSFKDPSGEIRESGWYERETI